MPAAKVRVIARLVRGKVYTPLNKKSIVKNPLQANKSMARMRCRIADRGKRPHSSEISWVEGVLITATSFLGL